MKEFSAEYDFGGKSVKISTGKIAQLSRGAVMLTMGGTTVLATASIEEKESESDFLPLSVEYIEKMYASGSLSSSKFIKREGFPTDSAIIKARQVDHSIRSLFPKSFTMPLAVVLTVLTFDGENDPESLAVFGASLALMQTGAPFMGPCSSVIASLDKDHNVILNPTLEQRHNGEAEFVLSAVDGKFLNIEGWAKEVPEVVMNKVLDDSLVYIEKLNQIQKDFIQQSGVHEFISHKEWNDYPADEQMIKEVEEKHYDEIEKILTTEKSVTFNREAEISKLTKKFIENAGEENELSEMEVDKAMNYVARKILRKMVKEKKHRITGRKLQEIRPLAAEVDVLPTVHGSALFSRGLTQSLSIVTLAPKDSALLMDGMEGESSKAFMHHYNMPSYSTGEAGRFSYKPGRREIGHGAIGENALMNMVPSQDDFPYTIRVVSEIMTSNGSTSMAATCASSLALMAAGVPLKEQVAGIGVGLITHDESSYDLLLDIEGIEDFYGDMDFKVCGTKNGITAIQYENKIRGVKPEILKEAFALAQDGRTQVLEVMNSALSTPRKELSPNAPLVDTLQIKVDEIGELIGPGGKNIKALIMDAEQFGGNYSPSISVEEDGKVFITAKNKEQGDFIKNRIQEMFKTVTVGEVYEGVVDKITTFGFFVNVSNKISGLCHISEITDKFIKDPNDVVRTGEKVQVKVIGLTPEGKINFSMKGIDQSEQIQQRIEVLKSKNSK